MPGSGTDDIEPAWAENGASNAASVIKGACFILLVPHLGFHKVLSQRQVD